MNPPESAQREAAAPRTFPPPRRRAGASGVVQRLRTAFTADLPLKALALVLAVMAWLVVREKVLADETIQEVPVDVVVPDTVVVVTPQDRPLINLRLRGPWNRVARAKKALAEGKAVELRLADLEHTARRDKEGTRTVSDASAFSFPFENPEIVTVLRPVTVRWNSVTERTVPVKPPVVLGTAEARVEAVVTLDDTSVRLRGPYSLLGDEKDPAPRIPFLTPDPVDASAWLKGNPALETPWPWESQFGTWRGEDDRLRGTRVLVIDPPVIRGKVRFRATGGEVLEHLLEQAGNPAWHLTHEYEIERSPEYDPATQVLKANVLAEPRVLERLKKNPGEWAFGIPMPAPPAEGEEDGQHKEIPVYLRVPPGVHATLEKTPTLFVTVRKR